MSTTTRAARHHLPAAFRPPIDKHARHYTGWTGSSESWRPGSRGTPPGRRPAPGGRPRGRDHLAARAHLGRPAGPRAPAQAARWRVPSLPDVRRQATPGRHRPPSGRMMAARSTPRPGRAGRGMTWRRANAVDSPRLTARPGRWRHEQRDRAQLPRWPLFLIAAPAAVAVWSGWVGLGGLCGFGVIHPLPGIDALQLNTAITLPVGVEAYGAYALGAWLTPGTPERARTFARRSAIGALVARHGRAGRLPPAGRRARGPRAVAGRRPGVLPAGGDARLRRGADAPAPALTPVTASRPSPMVTPAGP